MGPPTNALFRMGWTTEKPHSYFLMLTFIYCGVVVIAVGNEHGDTSSNPGWYWLHSTNTIGKGMNPIILPPAMGK